MRFKTILPYLLLLSSASVATGAENSSLHLNKWKDNWFAGAGFGVQEFVGSPESSLSFSEMMTPAITAYVGKWLTPSSGLRLVYNGATFKNNEGSDTPYFNIHGDYLWNFHNSVFGYKRMRIWELSPYIGAGWAASRGTNTNDGYAVNIGLHNEFRFTDGVYAMLDLSSMLADKEFDLQITDKYSFDKLFVASLGLTYRFKKRDWDTCSFKNMKLALLSDEEFAAKMAADSAQAAEKKAQAEEKARLTAQLNECLKKQTDLLSELEAEQKKVSDGLGNLSDLDRKLTTKTVFFTSASTTVANKYMVDIKPLVAYAKKNGLKLKVTGYADNATGTAEFNKALSQRRAQSVASMLEKLGMAQSDLIVEAAGGAMVANDMKYNRRVTVELAK